MKKITYAILGLCALCFFLHLTDLDDRMFYAINSIMHKKTRPYKEIWLNDYTLVSSGTIPCLKTNLSGITYCCQSKTLFMITNRPTTVYEIDKAGICLRKIPLTGFNDTEGIVYLDGKRFAVIEENEHNLNIIEVDNNTEELDRSNVIKSLRVNLKKKDNKGFEGIAYDNMEKCFYLVNENRPMQLISISGLLSNKKSMEISIEPDFKASKLFMDDLSGLHFDPVTRHLLFLSDEAKLVSEVSLDGKTISFLELEKSFSGLKDDVPQAEGIAMDDAGNIYICSEPNLFYVFSKLAQQH